MWNSLEIILFYPKFISFYHSISWIWFLSLVSRNKWWPNSDTSPQHPQWIHGRDLHGIESNSFFAFYANDEIFKLGFRIIAPFIIAIPITFVLISFATILNHFKPDAYLKLSLHWKHKIIIPILLFFVILTEQLANHSCPKENFMECQASKIRRFLFIPASVTSFLCQLIVIVDVIFGWTNIYRTLRGLFQPNLVASVGYINDDQDMSLQASASHLPPQLDQHLVSLFIFIFIFMYWFIFIKSHLCLIYRSWYL